MGTKHEPVVADAVQVEAAGTPPKQIREFVGRVATGHESVSVAVMRSPAGWAEPPQTPEFDEHTAVLAGTLLVHHDGGTTEVRAGQSVTVPAGVRVRYETPDGAEYVAVCLPAFGMDLVHREGT
ncbi:MAG TPA: cupin domain-containing protein [Acidimicrobiales bacterium]